MLTRSNAIVGAAVLSAAVGGAIFWNSAGGQAAEGALPTRSQLNQIDALSDAFNTVADAMKPSVVSVSTRKVLRAPRMQQRRRSMQQLPPGIPDEFRRFFEDDMLDRFGDIPSAPQEQEGLGSGVIVSEDGYVLTNNHVVSGADEVTVTLYDDREVTAKIVGTDPSTDLAVLKIDVSGLTPAKLGNSDETKVGQWVLAIGSPFGLQQTVTAGIISAKSRVTGIIGQGGYEDFLQTDAAINPGNSGGPLVNLRGEVIGINTAIFSRGGTGNVGIGFAIPSQLAKNISQSIIKTGTVVRGWLGAAIQPLNADLAQSFGYKGSRGVLLASIVPDSPAEKAGLKEGDIVTKLNGNQVTTPSALSLGVASLAPDSQAKLNVFREGKEREVSFTVGERKSEDVAALSSTAGESTGADKLGLSVESLTPAVAEELGYQGRQGVVVLQVEAGSLADRAQLERGDIIVSISGQPVDGLREFRNIISRADLKEGVRMQVVREGSKRYVFLRSAE
ncbi:MAG: DegQ family serine endoprotease [Pirellulaceae bacterium]